MQNWKNLQPFTYCEKTVQLCRSRHNQMLYYNTKTEKNRQKILQSFNQKGATGIHEGNIRKLSLEKENWVYLQTSLSFFFQFYYQHGNRCSESIIYILNASKINNKVTATTLIKSSWNSLFLSLWKFKRLIYTLCQN